MPIAAEKIVLDIEGQVKDMIDDSNRVIKKLDEIKAHTKAMGEASIKQGKEMEAASRKSSISITDFKSAYGIAMDVLRVGQQVWGATVDEMVKYGDQVKKLQTITGQSSEAVSNQIQLADDARVSYESLTAAMRVASKKGTDTTINGLANLADEYKKLQPGIERTQFLMEKFGKGGIEMAKILEMDSKAIRDFKANAGQILSEEDMRNIKEYNHSLDGMKDRLESIKGEASKKLVKLGAFGADAVSLYIDALDLMKNKHLNFFDAMNQAAQAINDEKAAFMATGDAADGAGESIGDLVDPTEAAAEAAKKLTDMYTGLLSSMFNIQDANDSLADKLQKADEKEAELTTKKAEILGDYLKKKQEIDSSNDKGAEKQKKNTEATVEYAKALADLDKDLAENTQNKVDAQKELEDAGKKRVYDLTQQKLAADGVIETGEYEYLQQLAVSMGLVTQAAADQAIAENQRADALVAAFGKTDAPMTKTLETLEKINAMNGTVVNYQVNFKVAEDGSLVPSSYYQGTAGVGGARNTEDGGRVNNNYYSNRNTRSRDSGGSGIAGTPYMIGTGAQPEMFIPNTNGNFVPNADKMGATYNITINNPKKETAENSIRAALKHLSFTGVTA